MKFFVGGCLMCKKLMSLMCFLALVSTSFGIEVANFGESGNGLDGFIVEWGITASVDTIGATSGSGSLKIVSTSGWYQGSMDKTLTAQQVAAITSGTATSVAIDMTRFASDWTLPVLPPEGGPYVGDNGQTMWVPESRLFCSVSIGAQNADGDWNYYGGGQEATMLGGSWYPSTLDPAHWPWLNGVQYVDADGTSTELFDLAPVIAGLNGLIANGFDQNIGMDMRLIINAPGYTGSTTYYLDNIQLIPEPATMTLLGLGLALLRRKH
jgi:hypothetical protein